MHNLDKKLAQYAKNGWAPVGTKHHPERIKKAIKAARFRPAIKECYANSQRMILLHWDPHLSFDYVEGVVEGIIPYQHAWLQLDGERVDLTLLDSPKILYSHVVPADEVRRSCVEKGVYGPVRGRRLNLVHNAIMCGVPIEGCDEAEITSRLNQRFQSLNSVVIPQS